jgi:hypothetical protein
MNMNILANCQKRLPADKEDPTKADRKNPCGVIPNPQWESFLTDWKAILEASTELEYTKALVQFRTHPQVPVGYIERTWLKWKEKLVAFWVDQCLHFGIRVTSPIEGCHAMLKAYLQVSTADLKGVFDRLLPFWPTQHNTIQYTIAAQKNRILHCTNISLFSAVSSLVYDRALIRILGEVARLHRVEADQPELPPCNCIIQSSLGLLCYHVVFQRRKSLGFILPSDIHAHWYYERTEKGTLFVEHKQLVLEPAIVKGKCRSKRAKGKAKGEGVTGMLGL